MKSQYTLFHYLAGAGLSASSLAVISLLISVPMLMRKASLVREEATDASTRYKINSNRLWQQMMKVEGGTTSVGKKVEGEARPEAIQYFTRAKRSPWGKHLCQGCHTLSCSAGSPGPNGPPGIDGAPGDSGRQGESGSDGYDVQMEPEHDLPCVICPSGPPGMRGNQGERGLAGEAGAKGDSGLDAQQGGDGAPGKRGPPGSPGLKGPVGRQGPQGDQVVAGTGIKGEAGPPGPAGPMGPPGVPGKSSKDMGPIGKPGPVGPIGDAGKPGDTGGEGSWGPPGEPGEPASYCQSDCGVSQILAPTYSAQQPSQPPASSDYGTGSGTKVEPTPPNLDGSESHEGSPAKDTANSSGKHKEPGGYSFFWVQK